MIVGSLLGLAEAVLGKAMDVVGWWWIDLYRWKTRNSSMLTMTGRLREVMPRRYAARGNSILVMGTATRMRRGAGAPGRSAARSAGCVNQHRSGTPPESEITP
ncbi:MAG TPA: hypothetical protein VHY78_01790 [Stellaceae bacterium]|jgi:hypothetical protein|nr:hypothetical protein [Stellaceae bacterium]